MVDFSGKVVIVTGGGSGIGKAAAQLYARNGATVVVSDVDQIGGHETVRSFEEFNGQGSFIASDVSSPEDCQTLVQKTLDLFGHLDIAFNNAGIGGESNSVAEYSIEGWQKVIAVNLSGVFYCMKYEIHAMLEIGGGAIVNMSSILGAVGFGAAPAYVAAKHGVVGLTRQAALDYSARNIRINAVGPAFIRTPMISALENDPQAYQGLVNLHPIGRLGTPEEVAELVVWLSSEKASFITGAYYPVDGGFLAR